MTRLSCLFFFIIAVCHTGCGVTVYQPRVIFDPNDAREINDADILKAFSARPQLKSLSQIAFYEMGKGDQKLIRAIQKLHGVAGVYEIPALLVEGRRFFRTDGGRPLGSARTVQISLKKLRLLAARARCDLLVLSSTVPVIRIGANWTVVFAPLLVTQLFVPMMDLSVTFHREVFVVDVRNGYMYRQVKASETQRKRFVLPVEVGKRRAQLVSRVQRLLRRTTLRQLKAVLQRKPARQVGSPKT